MIFQMDEIPTYVDNIDSRTIDFKGRKSIEVTHTGNNKNRFTISLTISANGDRLPSFLIFKKLAKPPQVMITDNLVLTFSASVFMEQHLMKE